MRDNSHEALNEAEFLDSRPFDARFQAASDDTPPAPAQMLARLGLLFVIALGFGLVAQILVGRL